MSTALHETAVEKYAQRMCRSQEGVLGGGRLLFKNTHTARMTPSRLNVERFMSVYPVVSSGRGIFLMLSRQDRTWE